MRSSHREMTARGERPMSFVMDYVVVGVVPGKAVTIKIKTVSRLPPGVDKTTKWKGYTC